MGLLGPYRVLDLTEERGLLTGGLLADVAWIWCGSNRAGGSSARHS